MYGSSRAVVMIGLLVQSLMLLSVAGCGQKQGAVALYVDAVTLKDAGQNKTAVEKLEAAVKSDPDFTLAHSLLCEIYQEMGDYERSAAACTKAVQLNPWSFEDNFNLGWSFLMMKRYELAAPAFGRACEIEPDHLAAHVNAAMSYYEIGDYRRALFYGKRIRQIDPNTEGIEDFIKDVEQAAGETSPRGAPERLPLR